MFSEYKYGSFFFHRKRPLAPKELEQLAENVYELESEGESVSDPFDSDDSVQDQDYQPPSFSDTNDVH